MNYRVPPLNRISQAFEATLTRRQLELSTERRPSSFGRLAAQLLQRLPSRNTESQPSPAKRDGATAFSESG
jgi:hypothetical protein